MPAASSSFPPARSPLPVRGLLASASPPSPTTRGRRLFCASSVDGFFPEPENAGHTRSTFCPRKTNEIRVPSFPSQLAAPFFYAARRLHSFLPSHGQFRHAARRPRFPEGFFPSFFSRAVAALADSPVGALSQDVPPFLLRWREGNRRSMSFLQAFPFSPSSVRDISPSLSRSQDGEHFPPHRRP